MERRWGKKYGERNAVSLAPEEFIDEQLMRACGVNLRGSFS